MTRSRRIRSAMLVIFVAAMTTRIPLLAPLAHAGSDGDSVRGRMMEILNEVSDLVKQNYYDPRLKNLDWKAGVEVAQERIRRADHEGEMAAAISGLLVRLNDSHTYFFRPGPQVVFGFSAKAFGDDVRIYEIMSGGPAEAAGLQRGDKIVAVEDFAANRKVFDDQARYFEHTNPRLTLTLKIVRGGAAPRDFTINGKQRATSSKDFVRLNQEYNKEQEQRNMEGTVRLESGGVAYLRFPSFMVTPGKEGSLLKKAEEARSLILDLRDDEGGREETMTEMAGHFLSYPTQLAVGISRNKQEEIIAKPRNPNLTAPLFILVDSHSASASEIFARALQLKKRATIVGDVTAGKVNLGHLFYGRRGLINLMFFGVSITTSKAVMPDGEALEDRGVLPDVRCVPTEEDVRLARDPCLESALLLAREAALKMARDNTSQTDLLRDEAKSLR
jgi:C-terminal peptidase prc